MKQYAPAADRNREPVLGVIRDVLPPAGVVLEIASGTGQHVAFFAAELPGLTFQPSDLDPVALASIRARVEEAGLDNLRPPVRVDVSDDDWGIAVIDALICSNMIHISPWQATEGLFRGAGRLLSVGAPLVTYGPYRFHGEFTAPSNAAFDASLRRQDASWGVRDVVDLERLATEHDLRLEQTLPMPANNHILVFRRVASADWVPSVFSQIAPSTGVLGDLFAAIGSADGGRSADVSSTGPCRNENQQVCLRDQSRSLKPVA